MSLGNQHNNENEVNNGIQKSNENEIETIIYDIQNGKSQSSRTQLR